MYCTSMLDTNKLCGFFCPVYSFHKILSFGTAAACTAKRWCYLCVTTWARWSDRHIPHSWSSSCFLSFDYFRKRESCLRMCSIHVRWYLHLSDISWWWSPVSVITITLWQLHWLPVCRRVICKVVGLDHQLPAPPYLVDDCRLLSDTGQRTLRLTSNELWLFPEHPTDSVTEAFLQLVLDCGVTFHPDYGCQICPFQFGFVFELLPGQKLNFYP